MVKLPLPDLNGATPNSELVGIKNWNDEKCCWIGIICQIMLDAVGKEFVQVYDVVTGETQVEVDDAIRDSIATRPWE